MSSTNGSMTSNLGDKLEIFAQFYEELYTSIHPSQLDIHGFLDDLSIPCLSNEHCQMMDCSFTMAEVEIAIGGLKNNKVPGLDSFMAKFYKKFNTELVSILHTLFNDCLNNKRISPSWLQACMVVILKTDRDLTLLHSYRPIPILNIDYKILMSIWLAV